MNIFKILNKEYRNYVKKPRRPNFIFALLAFLKCPHFRIILYLRYMQNGGNLTKILIQNHLIRNYSSEISEKSKIGENIRFMHLSGIVIGDGVSIGDNCILYQGVTLGQSKSKYPHIGDNVTLYPYATILGNVTVGNDSIILAHSVVTHDVPANSIVAGIPAKVIKSIE